MSTQILTKKIKLKNELEEHVLIKDKISQVFHDTTVHAISIDYDDLSSNKQSVLKTNVSHGLGVNRKCW